MHNKRCWLLLLLILALTLGCVEKGEKAEIKIVDQLGREVYVPKDVQKVVSLWPEATSVLVALNCEDKIVGLDSGSLNHKVISKILKNRENITDLGNPMGGTLNLEKLVKLKPDVVFMYTEDRELADKIQNSLGIPVVCVRLNPQPSRNLSFDMIDIIGKCVGKEERAKDVRKFVETKISEITSITSKIPDSEKVRVYVTFPYDEFKTSVKLDVIDLAGGKNVAEGYKGVKAGGKGAWHTYTVNLETIIAWNPDIIILHGFGYTEPEDIINDSNWQYIKAVRDGKVYKLTLGWGAWDLGSLVVNTITFAKAFYPDRFDFKVEEECNKVYEYLYGVEGLYTKLKKEMYLSDV
jgi:iron complex transport system substrate-binding protein